MIQLKENGGIPQRILVMMSVVGGLTVANLYYNQPLKEYMRRSILLLSVFVLGMMNAQAQDTLNIQVKDTLKVHSNPYRFKPTCYSGYAFHRGTHWL